MRRRRFGRVGRWRIFLDALQAIRHPLHLLRESVDLLPLLGDQRVQILDDPILMGDTYLQRHNA